MSAHHRVKSPLTITEMRIPMPPTNNEAYKKNTKEQYEALGRFVEKFELMVNKVWPAPGLDDTRLS